MDIGVKDEVDGGNVYVVLWGESVGMGKAMVRVMGITD